MKEENNMEEEKKLNRYINREGWEEIFNRFPAVFVMARWSRTFKGFDRELSLSVDGMFSLCE